MNKIPKVSVIMSVYNGATYLQEAIDSILNQTFKDFEFIIINDCSTDRTEEILLDYASQDDRIVLINNEQNLGLTRSLNKGLSIAKGELIARQDADDISLPDRLEQQVAYLDSNPETVFISTGVQGIDATGKETWVYTPTQDEISLRWHLLFRNPIRHSTVMWRNEPIAQQVGGYDPAFIYSQDYDLWVRIAEKFTIQTLPLILVKLRWHKNSITLTKLNQQDQLATAIAHKGIQRYFLNQSISLEEATRLRVMPRPKHDLQRQYYDSLNAAEFQQGVYQYLDLWRQFYRVHYSPKTAESFKILQHEVEKDLWTLLLRCKQQPLTRIGIQAILLYVISFPNHARQWILTSLINKGRSMLQLMRRQVKNLSP
jgi:glycosyltransferase involved in cell wall biosynthesis